MYSSYGVGVFGSRSCSVSWGNDLMCHWSHFIKKRPREKNLYLKVIQFLHERPTLETSKREKTISSRHATTGPRQSIICYSMQYDVYHRTRKQNHRPKRTHGRHALTQRKDQIHTNHSRPPHLAEGSLPMFINPISPASPFGARCVS